MTPEQLADLRRKAEAATPGPWEWHGARLNASSVVSHGMKEAILWPDNSATEDGSDASAALGACGHRTERDAPANKAFIAAANPAAVLALLDHVAALETQLGVAKTVADGALNERDKWREKALRHELDAMNLRECVRMLEWKP